jgi:hypothetical protein
MKIRVTILALKYLIAISAANEVGDFSPLGVAKSWFYQHKYSLLSGVGLSGEIRNAIFRVNIGEKSVHGDTMEYKVNMADSIYEWFTYSGRDRHSLSPKNFYYFGKIMEYPNGELETKIDSGIDIDVNKTFISRLFYKHTYKEEETRTDSTNANLIIVKIDNSQDSTQTTYTKNLGVTKYIKVDRFSQPENVYELGIYLPNDTNTYSGVNRHGSNLNLAKNGRRIVSVNAIGKILYPNEKSKSHIFIYKTE